jgi:esterase/lipase superfamily enzyme
MERAYHRWWSTNLERDMELLVFGHAGARVLVFPTRAGRFYDYENWGLVDKLHCSLVQGNIQLFCVDSVDRESLYAFHRPPHERIARHRQYERYILEEVVPLTEGVNTSPYLVAHGCSLGAYHALNLGLRHPHLVHKVVALSGRYDLTEPVGSFHGLFDGYYDETIYFHTPSHFIPQVADPELLGRLQRMQITLAIGEEDAFLPNNRAMSQALWDKGIEHGLHIWPGEAHCAAEWRKMVGLYL